MLLDVLQCTQQPPLPGNYPAPNVSNVEGERLHFKRGRILPNSENEVVSDEDQHKGFPLPPCSSHLLQVGLIVQSLPLST